MNVSGCLSDDLLKALHRGELSDGEVRECESHLMSCEACGVRSRSVQATAPLLEFPPGGNEIARSAADEREAQDLTARHSDGSRQVAGTAGRDSVSIRQETVDPEGQRLADLAGLPTLLSGAVTESTTMTGAAAALLPSDEKSHTLVLHPKEGAMLGVYRLDKKLGEGGMGAVWKAYHTRLKKWVALKVLSARLLRDATLVARFEREMEAVGKLDHPVIVRAMDAGEIEGTHYLVMEYVEGTDFGELVQSKGARTVRDACEMVRQAAVGLAYAHKNGLVHRDIKPSNLFLTKDGKVKVLDLGLARLQGEGLATDAGAGLTGTGQILGTPDYMAPEQWEDTHNVGPASDLYALGCTLFFLLTGRAPFADEKHPTLLKKMLGHSEHAPPSLSAVRAELMTRARKTGPAKAAPDAALLHGHDIPPELEAIYLRLLAKDPAARFASADELATALVDVIKARSSVATAGVPTRPDEQTPQLPIAGLTSPSQPMKTPPGTRSPPGGASSRSRRTWLATVAGIAAVPLIGLIMITVKNREESGTTRDVDNSAVVRMSGQSDAGKPVAEAQPSARSVPSPAPPDKQAAAPKPAIAPFDAAQAKAYQEDWADYLNVPVQYTNSIGMTFRLIPPGEFQMGSTPEEIEQFIQGASGRYLETVQSQVPKHKVVLTRPIYLGSTEVTQSQYQRVMGRNPSHFSAEGIGKELVAGMDTAQFPVESVSCEDVVVFARSLGELELPNQVAEAAPGRNPADAEFVYRLPTEAEWEFACRAGETGAYGFGDLREQLPEYGWHVETASSRTHAVGELKANPFGLLDIHGNVWEWTQDSWELSYYERFRDQPAINPWGPEGALPERVYKGGGWGASAESCRAASRPRLDSLKQTSSVGFRMVMSVDAARRALKGLAATMR